MASAVDATFPADNVKVDKASFRAQLLVVKNEITALQARIGTPGRLAYQDFVSKWEIDAAIQRAELRVSGRQRLPKQLAFGIVSFNVSNN